MSVVDYPTETPGVICRWDGTNQVWSIHRSGSGTYLGDVELLANGWQANPYHDVPPKVFNMYGAAVEFVAGSEYQTIINQIAERLGVKRSRVDSAIHHAALCGGISDIEAGQNILESDSMKRECMRSSLRANMLNPMYS